MNGFVVRVNGIEFHVTFGRNKTLLGYLASNGEHCLGLGVVSVHVKRLKPDGSIAKASPNGHQGKCLVCTEPMLAHEEKVPFEPLPMIPAFLRRVEVHAECLVFVRHGRVGCQLGLCPECHPPQGQTIRDQARDALAFYKASNGRPRKRGTTS